MVTIADLVANMQGFGIYDFFLPFILAFAIFYGLLSKISIFGSPKERSARTINLVVALAAAAYITLYVVMPNVHLSTVLANMFGQTIVVILCLIAFLAIFYLMMNALQPGATWDVKKFGWLVVIFAIIIGVAIFLSSGGSTLFPGIPVNFNLNFGNIDPGIIAIIVVIVLIGLVVYFLGRGEGEGKDLGLGRK